MRARHLILLFVIAGGMGLFWTQLVGAAPGGSTIRTTKFEGFVLLNASGPSVTKTTGYVLLNANGPAVTKATGYVLLSASGPQVTKMVAYVILRARTKKKVRVQINQ